MPDQDAAQTILSPVQADNSVKAGAWQAFKDSANEREFGAKLQSIDLPQQVKADLWEAKRKGGTTPSAIPGAPNGLPPVPGSPATTGGAMQPPLPQGITGTPTRMGPRGIQIPQTDVSGQDFRTLGTGLSAVAALPAAAAVEAPAGLTGLSRIVPPLMRAGATAVASAPGAALQQVGTENPSAANVGKEMGAVGGLSLASEVATPFVQWLTSSRSAGAQMLQKASAAAGKSPVEISPATKDIVDKIATQSELGGRLPKVINDLLKRVGYSTTSSSGAAPAPLTYDEARILQSNASQLSAEEAQQFKGSLKGLLKQFAGSFSNDVQQAANKAGVGEEHAAGMKEYAMASARNRALAKAGKAAAAGAGIYGADQLIRRGVSSLKP